MAKIGYSSFYHKYVIPGGYINMGEEPIEAAVREIKEEIGLRAQAPQLKRIFTIK